jgi:hypothetical protein
VNTIAALLSDFVLGNLGVAADKGKVLGVKTWVVLLPLIIHVKNADFDGDGDIFLD